MTRRTPAIAIREHNARSRAALKQIAALLPAGLERATWGGAGTACHVADLLAEIVTSLGGTTPRKIDSTMPAPTDAQREAARSPFADLADALVAEMAVSK